MFPVGQMEQWNVEDPDYGGGGMPALLNSVIIEMCRYLSLQIVYEYGYLRFLI